MNAVRAGALWWRAHPSACPHGQRFWVQPPHPIITRRRLRAVLDQSAALCELARVLRPGGQLVVGELFGDPHWVPRGRMQERAEGAGLRWVGRSGTPLAYFATMQTTTRANP